MTHIHTHRRTWRVPHTCCTVYGWLGSWSKETSPRGLVCACKSAWVRVCFWTDIHCFWIFANKEDLCLNERQLMSGFFWEKVAGRTEREQHECSVLQTAHKHTNTHTRYRPNTYLDRDKRQVGRESERKCKLHCTLCGVIVHLFTSVLNSELKERKKERK